MGRNTPFVILFAVIVILVLGAFGWMIGNYAGTPKMVEPGTISDIRYRSAYTSGTGENKTRHSAEWRVDVRVAGQEDTLTRGWSPPAWMHEGAKVRVTYHVGRWNKRVNVSKVDKL